MLQHVILVETIAFVLNNLIEVYKIIKTKYKLLNISVKNKRCSHLE
jgi:hypothetical protein